MRYVAFRQRTSVTGSITTSDDKHSLSLEGEGKVPHIFEGLTPRFPPAKGLGEQPFESGAAQTNV
jgi:hypothetical protein